jgi:flagella basal body P-ring formation protein FlgA
VAALAQAASSPAEDAVRAAIAHAVRARVGAEMLVEVGDLTVRRVQDADNIVAVLDPNLLTGRPTRIALRALRGRQRAVRVGEAQCVIRMSGPHLELVAPVARGAALQPEDVRRNEGWIDGIRLEPMLLEVALARASRDLTPGDVLLRHDVVLPPAIRSGDPVRVRLLSGPVIVAADGVAAQNGRIGEEIRVVNPSSGRTIRARVVAPREVEVTHDTPR